MIYVFCIKWTEFHYVNYDSEDEVFAVLLRDSDNDNGKQYRYVCITTKPPLKKSNPDTNPATIQHAVVCIQLNIVAYPLYPENFVWDNVVSGIQGHLAV